MNSKYPTPFQQQTLWRALTGVAIAILGFLLCGLVWLMGNVLSHLQPVLVPLAVSGVVAYLLDPVVSWLQRKGMSRLGSVVTVFTSFSLFIIVMLLVTLPPIVNQAKDLFEKSTDNKSPLGDSVTQTLDELSQIPWIQPAADWALAPYDAATETVPENDKPLTEPTPENTSETPFSETNIAYQITSHAKEISEYANKFILTGTSTILATIGFTVGLAMVPIYLYYFLKESAAIKEHWHDYVPLKASEFKNEVVDTLQEINGYLISFFRGQILVSIIDGTLVGIALFFFGLPYALVIGVGMAFLGVIPFIGNIICLIPSGLIAYVHFNQLENRQELSWLLGDNPWSYVVAVVAIFFIVQQINSMVTAPKIVGDSVGLHPMTVIFSMLFWSLILGGFIGALLAVPLTAAIKVLFRRYIWEARIISNGPEERLPEPEEAKS